MSIDLNSRLTLSTTEAQSVLGIGKTMLYSLLGDGSISSIKVGKKRLVTVQSLREFVTAMESYEIDSLEKGG